VTWKPNVTVAAVIERGGRFLLIEEDDEGDRVFNQPAGHWEPNETLLEACAREALEESACRFVPTALLGVYRWHHAVRDITYLRFAFCGEIAGFEEGRALDPGIVRALWLTADEIRARGERHRSPLVMRCVEDYLAGKRFPPGLITYLP